MTAPSARFRATIERSPTGPLDVVYLVLTIGTFALALGALVAASVMNLAIAASHGRIWTRSGAVYRAEHPKLFATHRFITGMLVFVGTAMGIAVLFFVPPM